MLKNTPVKTFTNVRQTEIKLDLFSRERKLAPHISTDALGDEWNDSYAEFTPGQRQKKKRFLYDNPRRMSKAPDFGYLVTCPLSNDFSQ
jgi:hypothetical protein